MTSTALETETLKLIIHILQKEGRERTKQPYIRIARIAFWIQQYNEITPHRAALWNLSGDTCIISLDHKHMEYFIFSYFFIILNIEVWMLILNHHCMNLSVAERVEAPTRIAPHELSLSFRIALSLPSTKLIRTKVYCIGIFITSIISTKEPVSLEKRIFKITQSRWVLDPSLTHVL